MQKPTILLVDDEESTLNSLRNTLQLGGYKVLTARSEQEALQRCREEVVHLAVIDIRLIDNDDPDDFSGLLLASKMDTAIHIIILTGRLYEKPEELVSRVLGPDHSGHRLASDFAWKRNGPEELYQKIQVAFKTQIRVNSQLTVSLERGFGWRAIIDQIKMFRGADDACKHKAKEVLEDLACRLFYDAKALHLSPMIPGQGPCTVVKAQPKSWNTCVIKFGPRESIEREAHNYARFVRRKSTFASTDVESTVSRDMGAIVYIYVGGDVRTVISFHDYYRNPDTTDTALARTLDNLFKTTCGKWYEEWPSPEEFEYKRLDHWYREQLNLLNEAQVTRLRAAFDRSIKNGLLGQGDLSRSNGDLHLVLHECTDEILPDPVAFALDEKANTDFYPYPSRVAVTHGDLHGNNILVDDSGNTWLIDFYKTGVGPALRDFAELESDIKFDLLSTDHLPERYEVEKVLLASSELNEELKLLPRPSINQARAISAIQHLRKLAYFSTGRRDIREYNFALLFYALKRILGFTSSVEDENPETAPQVHALISAALISRKLSFSAPGKAGSVFLAHAYHSPWKNRVHGRLKKLIESLNYEVRHPLDEAPEDLVWPGVRSLIDESEVGFYEISSKNGNVYFELGYAIGRGRPYFALIDSSHHASPEIAPLLQGLLLIKYASMKALGEQVEEVLANKRHIGKRYFFDRVSSQEQRTRHGPVLLMVADATHQQQLSEALLSTISMAGDWPVESIILKWEVDIEAFYKKAAAANLVIGCFSSDQTETAKHANAELALALGMAHGIRQSFDDTKVVIILQERGSDVLTDLKSLAKPFQGTEGATETLKFELKAWKPGLFKADTA